MTILSMILLGLVIVATLSYMRSRSPESVAWPRQALGMLDHVAWPRAGVLVVFCGLVLVAAAILIHEPELFGAFLGFLVILGLALFVRAWGREFMFLMTREDSDFPGHLDKAMWAAVLIALPPVGLLTFRAYREARWPEPAAKPEAARDWP